MALISYKYVIKVTKDKQTDSAFKTLADNRITVQNMIIKTKKKLSVELTDKQAVYPVLPLQTGILFPGTMITIQGCSHYTSIIKVQHICPEISCLLQVILCPTRDYIFTMFNEKLQHLFDIEGSWLVIY